MRWTECLVRLVHLYHVAKCNSNRKATKDRNFCLDVHVIIKKTDICGKTTSHRICVVYGTKVLTNLFCCIVFFFVADSDNVFFLYTVLPHELEPPGQNFDKNLNEYRRF